MKQLEIQFFWPLTEQIELPLDFTPSEDFLNNKRKEKYLSGVNSISSPNWSSVTFSSNINVNSVTTNSLQLQPTIDYVGYWELEDEKIKLSTRKKPNWLHRYTTEKLLGWKWKEKK